MDLLSLVGQVTKRKGDLFSQAENLARKAKSQTKLEKHMLSESRTLVKALRDREIKWDEYHRTLTESTLVSALAAVYLGSLKNFPQRVMEKAWPIIIGDILPPLSSFLNETEKYLENGSLIIGDLTQDFADAEPEEENLWDKGEVLYPVGIGLSNSTPPTLKKRPTWSGIFSRVSRYLASPTYSFMALGSHLVKQGQGYTLMKRVARDDSRTCPDCIEYAEMGWQPLGSLPMPGKQCQCYDRCRCHIEYR